MNLSMAPSEEGYECINHKELGMDILRAWMPSNVESVWTIDDVFSTGFKETNRPATTAQFACIG